MSEESELRELLVQRMESSGALGKIRAELRASIFLALQESKSTKDHSAQLAELLNKEDYRLAASLVHDLLTTLDLGATASVFKQECGLKDLFARQELSKKLSFTPHHGSTETPVLVDFLRAKNANSKGTDNFPDSGGDRVNPVEKPALSDVFADRKVLSFSDESSSAPSTPKANGSGYVYTPPSGALSPPKKPEAEKIATISPFSGPKVDSPKSDGKNPSPRNILGQLPSLSTSVSKAGSLAPLDKPPATKLSNLLSMDILDGSSSNDDTKSDKKNGAMTSAIPKYGSAAGAPSLVAANTLAAVGKQPATEQFAKKSDDESEILEDISVDNELLKSDDSKSSKISF